MKATGFTRLWCRLKRVLSRVGGTRMVFGWVSADGQWRPHTRLSNTVALLAAEQLMIGDHVFVGHFSVLDASHGLTIGEGCQIGFFTGIFTHSSHLAIRLYGPAYVHTPEKKAYGTATVSLGAYCFVGAHATILPGTRLGKGCLVTAYSLVKGEFPDFAILSGNPARVVGDTRKADAVLLAQHPELRPHYDAWAGPEALAGWPTEN